MAPKEEKRWEKHPYIPRIIEKLETIKPYKVILFGSHAYGKAHEDSDIDLIVILNQKGISKNDIIYNHSISIITVLIDDIYYIMFII